MDYRSKATQWLNAMDNMELKAELLAIMEDKDTSLLEDAFFQDLSFGTAGLRGIIGPGTNRMNIYTVGRATQGLANYLKASFPNEPLRVAIARDSRHNGELFCHHAACVLAANGIQALLYPRIEPTPALSFAVRELGCQAGICMTASHNPAAYNGYKVYGPDGCQITSQAALAISESIAAIDPFTDVQSAHIDEMLTCERIAWIDDTIVARYTEAVLACGLQRPSEQNRELKIVYTPLCGTGLECIEKVLDKALFTNRTLVSEQAVPNGDFPTCTYPNPEEKEALQKGIETCRAHDADILLATDPDADRIGIAVKHEGDYVLPTGNEVGILLFNYISKTLAEQGRLPENAIAVSTIVSTAMLETLAQAHGITIKRTLTGFKYIGDIITKLEQVGQEAQFILGFEESYGYLSGTHVRDKDAINAALLICEMAAYYKEQGQDLIDVLEEIYKTNGYFINKTINLAFPGAEGAQQMKRLMETLRVNPPHEIAGLKIQRIIDYSKGINDLPPANVVEFVLGNAIKLILRPSGTEPKVKAYLYAYGSSAIQAETQLESLANALRKIVSV